MIGPTPGQPEARPALGTGRPRPRGWGRFSATLSRVPVRLARKMICSVFEQKGLAAKVFKRRRFFTATLKDRDSVQNHIRSLRNMAAELEAIGAAASDEDLAMTLLCSLPESWNYLVSSMEGMTDIKSNYVANRLIDEERRKLELSSRASNTESEFFTKSADETCLLLLQTNESY